jgi:hypothetical protein
LTFGLGIIILQGVSRRKSLAGVNAMFKITTRESPIFSVVGVNVHHLGNIRTEFISGNEKLFSSV